MTAVLVGDVSVFTGDEAVEPRAVSRSWAGAGEGPGAGAGAGGWAAGSRPHTPAGGAPFLILLKPAGTSPVKKTIKIQCLLRMLNGEVVYVCFFGEAIF